MKLREYQTSAIAELSAGFLAGNKAQILVMPTGSGKTATASDIIRRIAETGYCSLFLVHRVELLNQAARHLKSLGLTVGIIQGENTRHPSEPADVYVCTIQSIGSQGWPPLFANHKPIKYLFVDECHVIFKAHRKLFEQITDARIIGLTATPLRADLGQIFNRQISPITIKQLIELGHLSPLKVFCPQQAEMNLALESVAINYKKNDFNNGQLGKAMSNPKIVGDVISTWQAKAPDRQTLVFACNVAHAQTLCEAFMAEGIDAAVVTYRTQPDDRADIISRFRSGDLQVLVSVDALSVGFDVPQVDCGIMARPTFSQTVYLQQAGRLIRASEGKADAILLDHAGNALRHGLPEDFEPPPLGTDELKASKKTITLHKLRTCANCEAVVLPNRSTCQECGHDLPGRSARVDVIPGELTEFGTPPSEPLISQMEKRRWYSGLRYIGQKYGRKPTAAEVRFKIKFGDRPLPSWNHDQPEPPSPEVKSWDKYQTIKFKRRKKR
jgi:DNA repair protein RadD